MQEFNKPATVNQEIILDTTRVIMSKTDKNGILEFVNDYFVEVSGYEEYELMGKSIYCTQHPDMPEVIFKMMWEKLLNKEKFNIVIKNLAKDGKYYWAVSDFAFKLDENNNEIIAIYNRRKKPSKQAIEFFDNLYKKVKNIEKESGIALSEKYLDGHLEELGKTFDELLNHYTTKATDVYLKSSEIVKPVISIAKKTETRVIKEQEKKVEKPIKQETDIQKRVNTIKENQKKVFNEKKSKISTKVLKDLTNKVKSATPNKVKEVAKKITAKIEPLVFDSNKKKSLFERMFGKTEEELKEEKLRRGNK
jgi:PAS domain S-box-containing protein